MTDCLTEGDLGRCAYVEGVLLKCMRRMSHTPRNFKYGTHTYYELQHGIAQRTRSPQFDSAELTYA